MSGLIRGFPGRLSWSLGKNFRRTCIWKVPISTGDGSDLTHPIRRPRDQAPYKAVLTHGFVMDGEGRPMSKSLGNVILAPGNH